jgi:hypothetical protein
VRSSLSLFFAESDNDNRAIRELVLAIRSDIHRSRTKLLRQPIALVKGLDVAKRRTRSERVAVTVRALAATEPVVCVFFHEDADAVEPAHLPVAREIEAAYDSLPCRVVPVVPAWELETWWFLFPAAVAATKSSWKAPDEFSGRDVGQIRNSKEELRRCVRPYGLSGRDRDRFPDYREADSPEIAKKVLEMGHIASPVAASASWREFVRRVTAL